MQAQKMESIGTLAGGIAHEFNNILSIIIGHNELVMAALPKWSHERNNLEEIQIAGIRARDVVRQLLTFSRQDGAEKKPLNIGSVVKEAMKLIRSSIPANIDINLIIPDDVPIIFGNATQLNQMLINLCGNATDAMLNTGGMITIELSNKTIHEKHASIHPSLTPGRYIKLMVSDTGCGMTKKTLDRIFEPYFTTKEIGKGTGIGLAVIYGIIERHDGSISVESKPNEGTVFTILLPACEGLIEQKSETPIVLPTGNERILLVDDDLSLLKLGKLRLESLGYSIQGRTDPLEALETFEADPDAFDLVITDMAMPHMTGDQLASEILVIRPKMPIILCTGYSEKISEEKAYKIGIRSFVMKPMDQTEFATSVRKVLDETKGSTQD
jgi:CheY-like chemotaxis protein